MDANKKTEEIQLEEDLEPIVTKVPGVVPKKELTTKQKVLRAILVTIGIIIAIWIFIWSVNTMRYSSEAYIQKDILKYLEKRYGEKFEIESYRGMSFAYNYVQAYAYPVGKHDEMYKTEIQGYENKLGGLNYYDTYVMVKLTKEYEDYINPIIAEYFDEYKFYMEFRSEWITNNLPPDTKLEDLWGLRANVDYPLPATIIYLPPNSNNDLIKNIVEEMAKNQYRGSVQFKCFLNRDSYLEKKRNDWGSDNGTVGITYEIYTMLIYSDSNIEYYNSKGEIEWD